MSFEPQLSEWFDGIRVVLAAENGCYLRWPDGEGNRSGGDPAAMASPAAASASAVADAEGWQLLDENLDLSWQPLVLVRTDGPTANLRTRWSFSSSRISSPAGVANSYLGHCGIAPRTCCTTSPSGPRERSLSKSSLR